MVALIITHICCLLVLQGPATHLAMYIILAAGKLREAEALYQETLEAWTRGQGIGYWAITYCVFWIAQCLKDQGK